MNNHTGVLSEDEAGRLGALWASCANDEATLRTTAQGQAAFRMLAQQVGAARAWWLVSRFGPADLVPTGQKPLSRMDTVPDRIEIWMGVRQGGTLTLQRLDPPLVVNKAALVFEGADGAAFRLFGNGRWWTRDAGLHGEYALPFTDEAQLRDIDVILAIGLGEDSPRTLFEAHRNAGLLSVLPLGTPTNTISGEPAGDLAQDADTWWRLLSQPGEGGTLADLSRALTGDPNALGALPGGTRNHRVLNQQMIGRAVAGVVGSHPQGRVGRGSRGGPARILISPGAVGRCPSASGGPIAPVRIGEQPYGVLPVTRLAAAAWIPRLGILAWNPSG